MQENLLPSSEPDFRQRSAATATNQMEGRLGIKQSLEQYLSKNHIDSELLNLFAEQWHRGNRTGEWGKWI
jgi:hypothetical protein